MKKTSKKMISFVCSILVVCTVLMSAFTAFSVSMTESGYTTIKNIGRNTQIGNDVSKSYTDRYSTIFAKKGNSDNNYYIRVWVKDLITSKDLSNKTEFLVTGTSKGHWIPYTSNATFKKGDVIRFIGEQSGATSKGLYYTIYGDKAVL